MVAISKTITEKSEPEVIRDMRLKLKNARVSISKKGKELREEAIAYQKAVIGKEKELIGLIEPEEERLAGIEEIAKKRKEMEDRVKLIPMRRDRIKELDILVEVTDEFLCSLDTAGFQEWTNKAVAEQNENKRLELEAKEQAIKEAEARIEQERLTKEREEKAREEERQKAEDRIKEAEAEAARRVKEAEEESARKVREAEEKAKRDAEDLKKKQDEEAAKKKADEEAEAKRIADETAKREADERYRQWLADNGATPEVPDWIAMKDPYGKNEMVLYKEVSRFTL